MHDHNLIRAVWNDHCRLVQSNIGHPYATRPADVDEYLIRNILTYPIIIARNWTLHMTNEERLGLPPAFPVALSKSITSHFGFRCDYDGRFMFISFHAAYAAKFFLTTLLHGIPYKWVAVDKIVADNGLTIKGETPTCLADALEHDMTDNERKWRAPEPYPYYWAAFLGKRELPNVDYSMPKHLHPTGTATSKSPQPQRRKLTDEQRRAKAVAKVRAGDHVTIAQIATELNSEPRVLRALLRRLAIDKPAHGWAWPPSEATKIKSKLSGLLRAARGA